MHTYTHTYVHVSVSAQTYAEIRAILHAAGYADQFQEDRRLGEVIDMHGLALCVKREENQDHVQT